MNKFVLIALCLVGFVQTIHAETLIPQSTPNDKGKFYLVESKRSGKMIAAIYKYVGEYDIYYTKVEINCLTLKMREIGSSYISVEDIEIRPSQWFDSALDSNKKDLANFVCRNK